MGRLAYLASGMAVLEFTVAVPQVYFGKRSHGYFDVLLIGDLAEQMRSNIRVGMHLKVSGALWMRQYRSRRGELVSEFKIIARRIKGD